MKRRPKRDELGPGEVLCSYCTARCCKYFALPIEKPTSWSDFDDVRWYLAHEKTSVFVDDDGWFLLVQNRCGYLQADNRCGVYNDRMRICRSYNTADCEYDDDAVYDKIFERPEQIWEYAEALLPPRRGLGQRRAAPKQLPILTA